MNMGWGDLEELMKDPEFRERNGAMIAQTLGRSTQPAQADVDMSRRGRKNRAKGQRFEDEITALLDALWIHGVGMVFNTGPKVITVGKGEIRFKPQNHGKFSPPQNPPDYMGQLFGIPVAFDAKVSHSSRTYYATRKKKASQHEGILAMGTALGVDALTGYLIEWEPRKISLIHVLDVADGKVRQSLSRIMGKTVEEVLSQWAKEQGKKWPL